MRIKQIKEKSDLSAKRSTSLHHCSIRCTLTPNFLLGCKLCYVSWHLKNILSKSLIQEILEVTYLKPIVCLAPVEVGFIHHSRMMAYNLWRHILHTRSKSRLYVLHTDCTYFSLLFFFNEYRDDKIQCYKGMLIYIYS